jgi:two-component system, OmpR family, alkaline phosphatase synthesis response regulator PhoP
MVTSGYRVGAAGRRHPWDMRVLVIDDEPDVLLLCRLNLEFAGHDVLQAADGESGLEVARRDGPDVIVLDVMLPHRDGLAILGDLGASEATRDTPVILLTAKTQAEDRLAGWRAGCSAYVAKPFSPASLADTVDLVAAMTAEERDRRRAHEIAVLDRT